MVILISDAFDASLPGMLSRYGEVTADKNRLPEAEIVLIRSKTKATKEYIDSAPKLKLIIRGGVGMDNIDVAYAKQKGIKALNTPEASSVAVAELAFAMMTAMPNRLIEAHNSTKEGKWLKKELKRTELYQKTLGILGLGRIGVELAKRAKAFDMKIIAYDPYVKTSEYARLLPTLKEMLNISDYVSMHMPLTDETKGMINKETLKEFKNGAYLINTGRGKTVIEADIVEALKSGKLAGYATDVFYSDPPENSPLINAPNALLAPHIGASTHENLLRIGTIVERIISEYSSKR